MFKKITLFVLFLGIGLFIQSCATETSNVSLGTILGGIVGASVDHHNRWRGGAIGAAVGAVAGETMYQIQQQAINDSVNNQAPVYYSNGNLGVQSVPITRQYYDPMRHTVCQKVRVKIIQNGQVVKNRIREVCRSTKETNNY